MTEWEQHLAKQERRRDKVKAKGVTFEACKHCGKTFPKYMQEEYRGHEDNCKKLPANYGLSRPAMDKGKE